MLKVVPVGIAAVALAYALPCAFAQEQELFASDSSRAAMRMVIPSGDSADRPTFAARPEKSTSALFPPSGMQIQSGFSVLQSVKGRQQEASFFDLPETGYSGSREAILGPPKK
jgi:hypothetical protein